MTIDQDIAIMKNDIRWIKQSLTEIKTQKQKNVSYAVALLGSIIMSVSSIIIGVLH